MRPVKREISERAVENELVRRVKALGGLCDKVITLGQRGFFDRLVVLPGPRVIFVEVKRPRGGHLAAHQAMYAMRYRNLGLEVAIVKNSADIDRLLSRS